MVKCKYFQLSLDKGTEESEWRESFKKKKKGRKDPGSVDFHTPPKKSLQKLHTCTNISSKMITALNVKCKKIL